MSLKKARIIWFHEELHVDNLAQISLPFCGPELNEKGIIGQTHEEYVA